MITYPFGVVPRPLDLVIIQYIWEGRIARVYGISLDEISDIHVIKIKKSTIDSATQYNLIYLSIKKCTLQFIVIINSM